jgi:glycosyltransferase involved in cell wall biosynthesis
MEVWKPVEQKLARELHGLPLDLPLLLFGTSGANSAHHKGLDLLVEALDHLRGQVPGMELVIFGQHQPRQAPNLGLPVHYMGHLHDDLSMRLLYSAVDALAIPSRIDNLPNTGVESMACGTPVIAFDVCGFPDIVTHKFSGYLAKPFEANDLAAGIKWIFADSQRLAAVMSNSRLDAINKFGVVSVAAKYREIYGYLGN